MTTNNAYGMLRKLDDGSLNYEDVDHPLHPTKPPDRNNAYGMSDVLDNGSSNYEDILEMEPDVMTENSAYNTSTSEKLSSYEEENNPSQMEPELTENVVEMV